MTAHRGQTLAALVVVCASVTSGCGASAGTKAGGTAPPVTLRIGTDDQPGRPAANQIDELARQVERLSEGMIRIEPVWNAAGDGPDWDQRVARMVSEGELDLGLIPSRSWDTEGVRSLRALNAPFLVTNEDLLAAVVSGELAVDLMSGLSEADVVGLALMPEGLRHPFGFEQPLLGPDDYAGAKIRTPTSDTTAKLFDALGATTTDDEIDPSSQAGMESSYFLDPSGIAAGDVTFYPKVNTLVINEDAADDLSEGSRDILAAAAARTRDWAIETLPSDAEAAATYCAQKGEVVLAGKAVLADLEQASAPVYRELELDGQTRTLVETIRAMKSELPGPAPTRACDGPAGATEDGESSSTGDPGVVNGVFRFEITDAELGSAGITDPADIDENHGVYTWTLEDGTFCWEAKAPNPQYNPNDCGTYTVDGDRLTLLDTSGLSAHYRWSLAENGDLRLNYVGDPDPIFDIWGAEPWTRISDLD